MSDCETCRSCRYWNESEDGLGTCGRKEPVEEFWRGKTLRHNIIYAETWEYESCQKWRL